LPVYEGAIRDTIGVFNEFANLMNSVRDARSARRVRPRLQALLARYREIQNRRAQRLTPEEEEQLERRFAEPLRAALSRAIAANERLSQMTGQPLDPPRFPTRPDGSPDVRQFFHREPPAAAPPAAAGSPPPF
jgi:hypothetical protein